MRLEPWMWVAFAAFVAAMLLLDLSLFGRRGQEISMRRAIGWSIGWTALGVVFAVFLWAWQGPEPASAYLAGFLIEKSLSIDNLFVFALVFGYFGAPPIWQRRALFWGSSARSSSGHSSSPPAQLSSTPFTTRSTSSARSWF